MVLFLIIPGLHRERVNIVWKKQFNMTNATALSHLQSSAVAIILIYIIIKESDKTVN